MEKYFRTKKKGITIFLTTHYIEEAEYIADKIGIIDSGEIKTIDEKVQIIDRFSKKKIKIFISKPKFQNPGYKKKLDSIIKKYKGKKDRNNIIFELDKGNKKVEYSLISDLLKKSVIFDKIETENSNLEKIFIKILEK